MVSLCALGLYEHIYHKAVQKKYPFLKKKRFSPEVQESKTVQEWFTFSVDWTLSSVCVVAWTCTWPPLWRLEAAEIPPLLPRPPPHWMSVVCSCEGWVLGVWDDNLDRTSLRMELSVGHIPTTEIKLTAKQGITNSNVMVTRKTGVGFCPHTHTMLMHTYSVPMYICGGTHTPTPLSCEAHTHTRSCTVSPCIYVGGCAHTRTHTCAHAHHVPKYTCGGTHTHTMFPCIHVGARMHTHTHARELMHTMSPCIHVGAHTHAQTQCPHAYMWGHTHAHNTHMHRTRTHSTDRHGRLQAVHVMTTVTLITQQHFLGITLAATDTAASQQGRAVPLDALVQRSQVKEDLGQAGAAQHRLFPALVDHPPPMLLVWRV